MPVLLKAAWELTVAATGPFITRIVNTPTDEQDTGAGVEGENALDEDGDVVGVEQFIDVTFALFCLMAESSNRKISGLLDKPATQQVVMGGVFFFPLLVCFCMQVMKYHNNNKNFVSLYICSYYLSMFL